MLLHWACPQLVLALEMERKAPFSRRAQSSQLRPSIAVGVGVVWGRSRSYRQSLVGKAWDIGKDWASPLGPVPRES